MQKSDGMNYAPTGIPKPVVKEGEFCFAVTALSHGHINGMTNGLLEAGATLKYVYESDPVLLEKFCSAYPQVQKVNSLEQILNAPDIRLVAAAAIPSERAGLGCLVMDAGKDYFTDKTPFTTFAQLEETRKKVKQTGQKYMVYFSERLHVESAVYAGQLIKSGAIGNVLQVLGMGPHRLNAPSRPDWFYQHDKYGGILCDIGSHQIEQYLYFSGAKNAQVVRSQVANYNHPEYPELEDFGEAMLVGDNGSTNYFRVDWFTPDGLGSWGDGRLFILGTKGYIELRKYINIGVDSAQDNVFYVTNEKEHFINVSGKVGYPFFGELILDCINQTELAMTQEHVFKAAELCLSAQEQAIRLKYNQS